MMNTNTDDRTIKQIIKDELPVLMKKDKNIRRWIIQLANEQVTEKTKEMETRTESRFDIILDELRKDREKQDKKWEENQEALRKDREKQDKKWEENQDELRKDREAQAKKWEEQDRKWKEQNRKWEENLEEFRKERERQDKKWEEQNRKWEQSRKDFDLKLNSTVGAIGSRWGIRTEASYRNALKGILKEVAPALEVLHFEEYDSECIVHDWPGTVEMDIIIKNGLLMLCELKSSMSRADMYEFYKKTLYYEKKHNRKGDRLIVISPMVEDLAKKAADELGIKVYSYAGDIQDEFTDHSV